MSTSDYAALGITYVISALALFVATRRSKIRYVRWQWRRPQWILLRLLPLVLVFHGLFFLLGVHPAVGFLGLALLTGIAFAADLSGLLAVTLAGAGWILYQWLFWLPARRQLILRNPRLIRKAAGTELVGSSAIVVSDLKPTGIIRLQGIERPARSSFGFVAKGEAVVVESIGDFEVIVRKENGQQDTAPNGGPAT